MTNLNTDQERLLLDTIFAKAREKELQDARDALAPLIHSLRVTKSSRAANKAADELFAPWVDAAKEVRALLRHLPEQVGIPRDELTALIDAGAQYLRDLSARMYGHDVGVASMTPDDKEISAFVALWARKAITNLPESPQKDINDA